MGIGSGQWADGENAQDLGSFRSMGTTRMNVVLGPAGSIGVTHKLSSHTWENQGWPNYEKTEWLNKLSEEGPF